MLCLETSLKILGTRTTSHDVFYKSEGEENCIEKKNITKKNFLNIKKADKSATKHSAGYCRKMNKVPTGSPAITVLNHLQI